MVGPSEVDESKRYYTAEQIADALGEAREECYREPETNLWKSFWDRLSEGRYSPPDPLEKTCTCDLQDNRPSSLHHPTCPLNAEALPRREEPST